MINFGVRIRLQEWPANPHRQLWEQTETLPAGTLVQVDIGNVPPLPTGDFNWFRSDLEYLMVAEENNSLLTMWRDYLAHLGGENNGTESAK
jgi:hypothetical protein